ncbi:MAG: AAA family ATPase, partial [Phycisphaerales bacterium]|nr:AAA family ATPase [Phycisphaerales bacterium]
AAADNDIERAQKGIVYIDEIDKVARKGDNPQLSMLVGVLVDGPGRGEGALRTGECAVLDVDPRAPIGRSSFVESIRLVEAD